MAENERTPYLSLVSKNDSSEHNSESFDTLSNSSFVVGGASTRYMISLYNNNNCEEVSKTVIIEILAGKDIVKAIIEFACRHRVGILVLTGSGSVSNVTILHPLPHNPPVVYISGHFNIVSLTGTYMNGHFPPLSSSDRAYSSFAINLLGPQSQVFSGVVGGKVMAASRVVVMASMFKKFEYQKVLFINGSSEKVEEGDPIHIDVVNAYASDANGIANNNVIAMTNNMSSFGITESTSLNYQLPPT